MQSRGKEKEEAEGEGAATRGKDHGGLSLQEVQLCQLTASILPAFLFKLQTGLSILSLSQPPLAPHTSSGPRHTRLHSYTWTPRCALSLSGAGRSVSEPLASVFRPETQESLMLR